MKFHSLSRNVHILIAFIVSVGLLSALFIYNSSRVHAAPITDFNAGNIIDDGVFYNKNSMSVQQIQTFLDSLIPNCDIWGTGTSEYGGGTRAQYAMATWGVSPPFVCLNKYYENPTTHETSFEKGGGAFAGGISAAQIIYNAAQTYNINPQVLLVMIKKESPGPLTADSWPLKSQYQTTMGYGCPDNADCNANYYGFYNQVTDAAWQFNYYKEHPNDFRYFIGQNNIQYSPDTSCGTKPVYIENMATLSLYIYTPYTPNDAALAAYPGQVACGAYGNRNFFAYFKEWFGISVPPEIQGRYGALGGASGSLGKAINMNWCNPDRSVCFQQFQNGYLIYTATTGAWESKGAIRDYWAKIGYQSGIAGYPTGGEAYDAATNSWSQTYQNGTIVGKGSTGFWFVNSNLLTRWNNLGGARSSLGLPVSATVGNNNLAYQQFQNGYIIYSLATGAWESKGAIRDYWAKIGYQNGIAGLPTGGEIYDASSNSWSQTYQNGTIVGKGSTGFWFVNSTLLSRWNNLGGANGSLGLPISTTIGNNNLAWQQFQNGYIIYSLATGAWESKGAIRDYWAKIGYQNGIAGLPTASEAYDAGTATWSQTYQHGTIYYKNGTGAWFVAS